MHIPNYKILLIPDFGNPDSAASLLPMKEVIDKDGRFSAQIIDLRQAVVDENPGQPLKEARIIDLAVQKLETVAREKILEWEEKDYWNMDLSAGLDPLDSAVGETEQKHDEKPGEIPPNPEENPGEILSEPKNSEPEPEKSEPKSTVIETNILGRKLKITKTVTPRSELLNLATPSLIVVFGKSAMLPGGIKECPVLCVNPEYDSEWPWKKRFYTDRKQAEAFCHEFYEHLQKPHRPTVNSLGIEYVWRRFKYPKRLLLVTDEEVSDEILDRYPRLVISDPELRDPESIACAIMDFKLKRLALPQFEMDRLMTIPAGSGYLSSKAFPFPFLKTVPMYDGRLARSIEIEAHSPYHNRGTVVCFTDGSAEDFYSLHNRHDLKALRDALEEAVKAMPPKKRILIVPDVLEPGYIEIADALRDKLVPYGHYVAVYESNYPIPRNKVMATQEDDSYNRPWTSLETWRHGLERCCKSRHFDLIVTLETGCLLASRITATTRIFVNPQWAVWEDMKRLDYSREEWEMARTMGMKANIRRDGPHLAMGWFTTDQIDGDDAKAHMERFKSTAYPPHIDLTTPDGLYSLAHQIHNFLLL